MEPWTSEEIILDWVESWSPVDSGGGAGGRGQQLLSVATWRKISNIQIRGKFRFNKNTSFLGISPDTDRGCVGRAACRVSGPWARRRASQAAPARARARRAAPGSSARTRWAAAAGCWNTKNHVILRNSIFCVSIRLKYSQGTNSAPGRYNLSWQYFTILN